MYLFCIRDTLTYVHINLDFPEVSTAKSNGRVDLSNDINLDSLDTILQCLHS